MTLGLLSPFNPQIIQEISHFPPACNPALRPILHSEIHLIFPDHVLQHPPTCSTKLPADPKPPVCVFQPTFLPLEPQTQQSHVWISQPRVHQRYVLDGLLLGSPRRLS